ncbi:hypothetical protein GCM10023310_02540 [Paenibacillus vulneris]|uniref:DUF3825 domain-containing protein n=1 Tax=Paenibacillus vulneris TaxID=1133364 RepID=A0ABW3UI70_9BACL
MENYFQHTFKRLVDETNLLDDENKNMKIFIHNDKACLNTGLFTKNFNYIYAYFEINTRQETPPWVFKGFFEESSEKFTCFNPLPIRAEYFSEIRMIMVILTEDAKLGLIVTHPPQ